ncbi:hypothetical protein K443DRAFT_685434 [Laccaria amethystina LaAM-08-1]|uniref:Uncharacterized protein n=1 Tax=Laccaria amethystina LaAM-08-1 TaxID=1095629 RepID=A0A0C9WUG9_9AGAR|nr:hypothetical protein K443DRAFT_685434 [Laccaria amethystina LaAM-08-1]
MIHECEVTRQKEGRRRIFRGTNLSKRLSASALQRAVPKPQRQGKKSHDRSRLTITLKNKSEQQPWILRRCLGLWCSVEGRREQPNIHTNSVFRGTKVEKVVGLCFTESSRKATTSGEKVITTRG